MKTTNGIVTAISSLAVIAGLSLGQAAHATGSKAPTVQINKVLQANALQAGSYSGFFSCCEKSRAHLVVSEIPERAGSFIGILLDFGSDDIEGTNHIQTTAYVIDPVEAGQYMMIPLTGGYSNIGLFNDNPSMSLAIGPDRIQLDPIEDNRNEAGNKKKISIVADSPFRLTKGVEGTFAIVNDVNKRIQVSKGINFANASLPLSDKVALSGKYSLNEAFDSVYVLKGKKISTYGEENLIAPQALAFFFDVVGKNGLVQDSVMVVSEIGGNGASAAVKLDHCKTFEDFKCKQ